MSRIRDFLPHQDGTVQAWVNFDGTTSGPTIADDFNVTSVTDSAVGRYSVTITQNFGNANYAVGGFAGSDSVAVAHVLCRISSDAAMAAGALALSCIRSDNAALADVEQALLILIGDTT